MNAYELDAVLSEYPDGMYGNRWNAVSNLWGKNNTMPVTVNGVEYTLTKIAEQVTSDEQFETYLIVEVDGKTFRKDGWYASHDGSYWDGSCYEVAKVEVITHEWKAV